jgi:hypothetical protein
VTRGERGRPIHTKAMSIEGNSAIPSVVPASAAVQRLETIFQNPRA